MSYTITNHITTKVAATFEEHLTMSLKENGLSLAITTSCGKILTYADVEMDMGKSMTELSNTLKQLFAELHLNLFGYKSSRVVVPSQLNTWIPLHLYESGRDSQYLNLVGKPQIGSGCYTAPCEVIKAQGVFSCNNTLVSAFKITFPGLKVVSQLHQLVTADFLAQSKTRPVMVAHLRNGWIDLLAFNGDSLLLSNTYQAADINEALYKSIEVMKTLGIETPTLTLNLCGNVGRDEFALYRNYFPNVALYTGRRWEMLNPEFQHLHTYREVTLLS